MRNIGVFTGSRADYGLLKPLMTKISQSDKSRLVTIVSGAHVSEAHGYSISEIEMGGFRADELVPVAPKSDSAIELIECMGVGLTELANAVARQKIDLIVILGDRYEAMAMAMCALMMNLPVAHIHGGELSLGAKDDSIRHAITKIAKLHFTSTEVYRRRVIQMGENPSTVFNFGAIGLDSSRLTEYLDLKEVSEHLGFEVSEKFFLVTYHPPTLYEEESLAEFNNMLTALDKYPDYQLLFSRPNSDSGNYSINDMLDQFVAANPSRTYKSDNFGSKIYLSLMRFASAVVGNSSSGIIEAPFYRVPTLDIGRRQFGRLKPQSVISVGSDVVEITNALNYILSADFRKCLTEFVTPYYCDGTSKKILDVIESFDFSKPKIFFDINFNGI